MTEDNNQQQASQNSLMSEYNNILDQSLEKEKERIKTTVNFTDALNSLSEEYDSFIKKNDSMSKALEKFKKEIDRSDKSIGSFSKRMLKMSGGLTKFGLNVKNAFVGIGGVFKSFSQVVVKYLDTIAKHPLVAIFVQVYKVIEKTFGAIKTLGSIMFTVFSQSLKYATRFVKFMVSLPLKIAGAAAKIGNSLRQDLIMTIGSAIESTKEMFDISEKYGSGAEVL
jgi:hypothetical protein